MPAARQALLKLFYLLPTVILITSGSKGQVLTFSTIMVPLQMQY